MKSQSLKINLDSYKNFFKTLIDDLGYELGFNMYLNANTAAIAPKISFEVSKGSTTVTIPYKGVIKIHTHPRSLYANSLHQPPSNLDYAENIYAHFGGQQVDIVVEKNGVWIYEPAEGLVREVLNVQPDINEILPGPLKEGVKMASFEPNEDFVNFLDVLTHNSNHTGMELAFTGELIREHFGEAPPPGFQNIDVQTYIGKMKDLLTDGMGFEVKFIAWDEPFEFQIHYDSEAQSIFKSIQKRGLNYWTQNDAPTIIEIANKSDEYSIIRDPKYIYYPKYLKYKEKYLDLKKYAPTK